MTTKTMSVVEEVYRWLESNPEVVVFCCKKIHKAMPWLDSNRISSALTLFCKEARLNVIGVTGKNRANVYERTDLFDSARKFAGSKRFAPRTIKPGYKHPINEEREALPLLDEDGHPIEPAQVAPDNYVSNRNLLLKRLYDLAERQLDLATEIEKLRDFVKSQLIL
jgi:hypothetical protein